jgi:bacillithiol biosynthesis cysteine-adding enzyme BshC
VITAITRDIGGSPLARAALAGDLTDWYGTRLSTESDWRAAAHAVAGEFEGRSWLDDLLPALQPSGEVAERLRAAAGGGLVVTGGQQPGLFGGPLYVLHKALTLLELANALERVSGKPVAPIFWAATDDADFAEASHVSIVRRGALERLVMSDVRSDGGSMADTPLGDVHAELERLAEACGSAPDPTVLAALRASYRSNTTVGAAYVTLLRLLLQPLGVAVLDAAHPTVRAVGRQTLVRALENADAIAAALAARTGAITKAGFRPQVADVPNLSLVFETREDGSRRRVPVRDAHSIAARVASAHLGPNVLLRPIMERQILPTVTYVGGAGEVSYFAQVTAVSEAIGVASPRISPRWSGTLLEPGVAAVLTELGADIDDFADPHAIESRVAREGISAGVRSTIDDLRAIVVASGERMRADPQTSDALARSIGSMSAHVEHRLQRLERRYAAAVKQTDSDALRHVRLARASLRPAGVPQERVLSFIPFLARYSEAIQVVREAAREHVASVIIGG